MGERSLVFLFIGGVDRRGPGAFGAAADRLELTAFGRGGAGVTGASAARSNCQPSPTAAVAPRPAAMKNIRSTLTTYTEYLNGGGSVLSRSTMRKNG